MRDEERVEGQASSGAPAAAPVAAPAGSDGASGAPAPPRPWNATTLSQAAQAAAQHWGAIHRPSGASGFAQQVRAAGTALDLLLARVEAAPAHPGDASEPFLDIRENSRLLRSAVNEARAARRILERLPRLSAAGQAQQLRVAAVAAAYFDATRLAWDAEALHLFLKTAQQTEPLDLEELWSLPVLMKFHLLGTVLADAQGLPDQAAQVRPRIQRAIKSMRELGYADWPVVAEPLIPFDPILQQDPAGAYPRMDFESREAYRKRLAAIARYSECTELQVAAQALELAQEAHKKRVPDPRLQARRAHIGYYLVDRGAEQLGERTGYRPPFVEHLRITARRDADLFYIAPIEVISVILIAAVLLPLVPGSPAFMALIGAFLLLLLPVTQGAVDLVNNIVTSLFEARALSKLDFSKGVPREFSTLVAVPTLLLSEKQLRELVSELEVRYLANQDAHLHFALITDLPDAVTRPRESDRDTLVDLAVKLINELNARYAPHSGHGDERRKGGGFLLFHRHRIFNARQGVWMGWERKRGKLLDLNKFLQGAFDAFPVKAGDVEAVRGVKYIITLDSDTQLPRGTAQQLVGAMAHPLNRAIIDPDSRIVTAGYGILQPRVGVSVQSAARSRLAALYSGQTGFDIYTRAISDVYQDLYGEGIFTGKGIYEVETLHAVLDRRFPRNALLSHDLIEGAYARAGLATDIEVIDDYPSHYSAYTRRKHRWVRGDWQIAQWLFSVVPDELGRRVRNPISTISRWKIFDNLRRSLVEPFTMLLLITGWLWLPGGPLYWTVVTSLLMFLPAMVQLVFSLGHAAASDQTGAVREAWSGFWQGAFLTLLNLIYLPHTTMLSLDAILRALIRRLVTGQRLLEWETAAEAETGGSKVTPVDRYLAAMPLVALAVAALLFLVHRHALLVATPILVLWGCAALLTNWLNGPPREQRRALTADESRLLRQHALRIWRYFYQFGGERHHYLVPDNVEEKELYQAARVSPTNLGLLLNARQAAVEFGFLTVPECADLTMRSLDTLGRLEKHRGHLYNWYNTETLQPLLPITVSSVDSGNFAASLYTLRTGAIELLDRPLLAPSLFAGLSTLAELAQTPAMPPLQPEMADGRAGGAEPWPGEAMHAWTAWALAQASNQDPQAPASPADEAAWWRAEQRTRIAAIASLVNDFLPWLLPQFAPLRQIPSLSLKESLAYPCLGMAADFVEQLDGELARAWATLPTEDAHGSEMIVMGEQLRALLPAARERLHTLALTVRRCSEEAFRLAGEMEFGFLVQADRQLLSIGYEVATGTVHAASYDMLASEARIAAFIAIANGEMIQQSWFKLGRTHTVAFGRAVLLSWTGTMFEYLMPSLWMRSFPDTLMARTLLGVVAIQRAFARQLGTPWGISESGYARLDDGGHYHYQAFGIPQVALKWDATAGPVIAPYASYLALGIDPVEALKNIRRMLDAGWMGAYGLYEAADYSASLKQPELVREWMAHHQGMSLLALVNLLQGSAVQRWFHANPHLQATELLLHEKPIREATLKQELKTAPVARQRPT
ncbi:MAG TPA: glucoamylase family protein [Acidobacteriaceae bacterium]